MRIFEFLALLEKWDHLVISNSPSLTVTSSRDRLYASFPQAPLSYARPTLFLSFICQVFLSKHYCGGYTGGCKYRMDLTE